MVDKRIAKAIGLNESIVIAQIDYWLKSKRNNPQKYHDSFQDGRWWVFNTYEQWQEHLYFWSIRTIRRIMSNMESSGLLLSGNYNRASFDKTKWYTIDYDRLDSVISPFVQNEHIMWPSWPHRSVQDGQTYTKDNTNTTEILNVLNGAVLKDSTTQQPNSSRKPFDRSILEKQIIKSCHKQGIDDCSDFVEIITFYYEAYMRTFHKEHPRLSTKAMDDVVSAICCGSEMVEDIHPETYKAMIERHFQTEYSDTDYNICHFMTEGIRNNRFYEACY